MKRVAALFFFLGFIVALSIQPVMVKAQNSGIRGAVSGSLSFPPPHKLWFGAMDDSTAVQLWKVAAYTVGFNAAGQHLGSNVANKDFSGQCTLGTNCAITFVHTWVAAPVCVATDTTSAAATKVALSGGPPVTTLTITGTGTDVIDYMCVGNPN